VTRAQHIGEHAVATYETVREVAAAATVHERLRRIGRERIGVYRGLYIKRLMQWPLRAALRQMTRPLRRQPDLVAFGSVRNRFADNSAYLFLHMAAEDRLRCVWISGSRAVTRSLRRQGYDARHRWSPKGLHAALRASIYVYSFSPEDVNLWLSDRATCVNLWHGVGVKRIERERGEPWKRMYAASDRSITGRVFADDRRRPDWLLTTSPATTCYFLRPFDIAADRCVELGYPRDDHLIVGSPPPAALVDRTIYERLDREDFVVGYFPTWRYDSFEAVAGGAPDLEEIAHLIAAQSGVVVFKPHFQSASPACAHPALVVLPAEADLNAYLGLCDVLITDYSSVAADFLLMDRPIVTFAPRLDRDLASGTFSEDPLTMQPGLLVRTTAELYGCLRAVREIPIQDNFEQLRRHYWGPDPQPSAARLSTFVNGRAEP
jgi:CDP-glycerol glycerophosphotransferase (TagB/SpsB family)